MTWVVFLLYLVSSVNPRVIFFKKATTYITNPSWDRIAVILEREGSGIPLII